MYVFVTQEDMNVIAVDWSHGAGLPYGQATANTRVVGAQVGKLINFLVANTNITEDDVHVIGHSLGAHVAGYAGQRVHNMSRITGKRYPGGMISTCRYITPVLKKHKKKQKRERSGVHPCIKLVKSNKQTKTNKQTNK